MHNDGYLQDHIEETISRVKDWRNILGELSDGIEVTDGGFDAEAIEVTDRLILKDVPRTFRGMLILFILYLFLLLLCLCVLI